MNNYFNEIKTLLNTCLVQGEQWQQKKTFDVKTGRIRAGNLLEAYVNIPPSTLKKIIETYSPQYKEYGTRTKKGVRSLRSAVLRGDWDPNDFGTPPVVSNTGRLINGNTRFEALMRANRAYIGLIVLGADDDCAENIDSNTGRSNRSKIRVVEGWKTSEMEERFASIKYMHVCAADVPLHEVYNLDFSEIKSLLVNTYASVEYVFDAVPASCVIGGKQVKTVAPIKGAFQCLAIRWPNEVREFWRQVRAADGSTSEVVWKFREYLTGSKIDTAKNSGPKGKLELIYWCGRVFRCFLDGSNIAQWSAVPEHFVYLKRQMDSSYFPRPNGPFCDKYYAKLKKAKNKENSDNKENFSEDLK